jgi:dTMP kinase
MVQDSPAPSPFLVFEGLDGSGKSTLIQLLSAELNSRGQAFTLTREPGGTPLAEEIRRLLLRTDAEAPVATTELLLYAASRAQHVAQVIRPAIAKGEWVMCDRFSASSVAFQCFARGLSREQVDWLNRFAQDGVEPSLTILLDLTVEESRRRQGKRTGPTTTVGVAPGADRMERESREFHERVRAGYLAQAKEKPSAWLVVDATGSPDEIKAIVMQSLQERKWLVS